MTPYYFSIEGIDTSQTTVTQVITVGARVLTFQFQWAIASAEQGDMVLKYLINRAKSDPLQMEDGNYNRDYDWFNYYLPLIGQDLDAWLDTNPILPVSVLSQPDRASQKRVIQQYLIEVATLQPIILLYTETMRWQFQCSCADTDTITGIVEPGGWFRNQDSEFAFRFRSARDYIGKEDINELALEFEVYDE